MGRPPIGKKAMTTAERVRRYWLKQAAAEMEKPSAAADARIRELEAELAAAKARIQKLELDMAAQAQALREERARRAPRPRSEPRSESPPPPPSDEALVRRNKAQQTEIRNLKARLDAVYLARMDFKTMSAIAKPLSPDHRKHQTRAELDKDLDVACRAFTAWKADKDRANRKGR